MEDLRIEVDKVDGVFHVTKNTLLQHILEEAKVNVPEDFLTGQLAAGFALAEAPTLAKTLVDFASKQENMSIKGGFLGTRFLTAADIEALAKLPSIDQLRAQLLGLISAPAQNIVGVVAGGVRQVVNVLDAYAKSDTSASDAAEAA
jgi:large subunit ribosomal protein L10